MGPAVNALNAMVVRFLEDLAGTMGVASMDRVVEAVKTLVSEEDEEGGGEDADCNLDFSQFSSLITESDVPEIVVAIINLSDVDKKACIRYLKCIKKLSIKAAEEMEGLGFFQKFMDNVKSIFPADCEHPCHHLFCLTAESYINAVSCTFPDVDVAAEREIAESKDAHKIQERVNRRLDRSDIMEFVLSGMNIRSLVGNKGFPMFGKIGKKRIKKMTKQDWKSITPKTIQFVIASCILEKTSAENVKALDDFILQFFKGEMSFADILKIE